MRRITTLVSFILFFTFCGIAQDRTIKVHFLYGSVPAKEFKDTERPWFGGKLGGHVGIEMHPNQVVNFLPAGKVHIFPNNDDKRSGFITSSNTSFWEILGGE